MTKKIMIVEDDDITIKYLENLFKDNGYETCVATDGSQALELLKNEKPDMITLDIQMPSEWGPRFYRKVSKDKELKKIPVIVISGLDGDHAVKDAVAFIRKPFDPDKLLGIVKSTIG
ncbi:MAG: response regulator [Desulfobacteraceae bacterium]|nr:response regulator [Desulfobacteraceae bacterium]